MSRDFEVRSWQKRHSRMVLIYFWLMQMLRVSFIAVTLFVGYWNDIRSVMNLCHLTHWFLSRKNIEQELAKPGLLETGR